MRLLGMWSRNVGWRWDEIGMYVECYRNLGGILFFLLCTGIERKAIVNRNRSDDANGNDLGSS